MSVEFPQFDCEHLRIMRFCANIDNPAEELVAWIQEAKHDHREMEISYACPRGLAFMLLMADVSGDEGSQYVHFHVNSAIGKFFRRERQPVDTPHDAAFQFFDKFSGYSPISLHAGAGFRVPLKKIPKRGVIDLVIDAEATVADATLVLTGSTAKFRLADENPLSEMTWNKVGEDEVTVSIEAELDDIEIADDYIVRFESLACDAFSKYALEKHDETGT